MSSHWSKYGFNESERKFIFEQMGEGGANFEGYPPNWKKNGDPFYVDYTGNPTYGFGHLLQEGERTKGITLLYSPDGKRLSNERIQYTWTGGKSSSREPYDNMIKVFWSDFYKHLFDRIFIRDGTKNKIENIWMKLGLKQKLAIVSYAFQVGSWVKFSDEAGGYYGSKIVDYLRSGDYKNAAILHGQYSLGGTKRGSTYASRRITEALFIAGYDWSQINEGGGKQYNVKQKKNELWFNLLAGNADPIKDSGRDETPGRFENRGTQFRVEEETEDDSPLFSKPKPKPKILQYKAFMDGGLSTDKFWNKWAGNIKSPLDITLLLNPPNVGLFNPVVPYCFDAGSELHLMIVRNQRPQEYILPDDGISGAVPVSNKRNTVELNWTLLPWSDVFADFVMINNGNQYISDSDSLNFNELVGRNTDSQFADIVSFKRGVHFNTAGWTQRGLQVLDSIKNWPGGLIYHDNHVEVLLHISKQQGIFTCAGNVSLPGESKGTLSDSFVGIKSYKFLTEFSDENQIYIVKRGTVNTYTNGLGINIKRTPIFNEYEQRLRNRDSVLTSKAFDLIQNVMEDGSLIT